MNRRTFLQTTAAIATLPLLPNTPKKGRISRLTINGSRRGHIATLAIPPEQQEAVARHIDDICRELEKMVKRYIYEPDDDIASREIFRHLRQTVDHYASEIRT